jgi:hypothetical protein
MFCGAALLTMCQPRARHTEAARTEAGGAALPPPSVAPTSTAAAAPGVEIAAQRLCDHVRDDHRPVYVEHLGADVVWSDGALLERATDLPPSVKTLVATPRQRTDGGIAEGAVVQYLLDVDKRRAEWHPGAVGQRKPIAHSIACEVTAGTTTALVDCLYLDYLAVRYPRGVLLVRAPLDAVVLVDGDILRGAVMPMRP